MKRFSALALLCLLTVAGCSVELGDMPRHQPAAPVAAPVLPCPLCATAPKEVRGNFICVRCGLTNSVVLPVPSRKTGDVGEVTKD